MAASLKDGDAKAAILKAQAHADQVLARVREETLQKQLAGDRAYKTAQRRLKAAQRTQHLNNMRISKCGTRIKSLTRKINERVLEKQRADTEKEQKKLIALREEITVAIQQAAASLEEIAEVRRREVDEELRKIVPSSAV
jgi:hypothetical protein